MWAVNTLLYKQNKKTLHCPSFCHAPLMCSLPLGMQAWQVNCIDATLKPCLRGRRPPPDSNFSALLHVKHLLQCVGNTARSTWNSWPHNICLPREHFEWGWLYLLPFKKYLQSTDKKKKKLNGWYHCLLSQFSWSPANQKLLNTFCMKALWAR